MNKRIYDAPWFIYIAECGDGTLYSGIARDTDRRISDHNRTNRCRYTRSRKPVKLVYKEKHADHNAAARREAEIKKLSRKEKLELIGG